MGPRCSKGGAGGRLSVAPTGRDPQAFVTRSHRPTCGFAVRSRLACSHRLLHVTNLICWGKCWGKKPKSLRNGLIINDLASVDGGVGFRLVVIGSPNDHLNAGNLA